jgi:hypothetical protein
MWGRYFMLNLVFPNSGGNIDMVAENQDSNYYTVEVDREANNKICHDVKANVKVFLEDIQFRNGYKVLRYRFWRDEPGRR